MIAHRSLLAKAVSGMARHGYRQSIKRRSVSEVHLEQNWRVTRWDMRTGG